MRSLTETIVDEHVALADLLERLGPEAPTLIERWTTADLAAHVASSNQAGGLVVYVVRDAIERFCLRPTKSTAKAAGKSLERTKGRSFGWAVDVIRSGPARPLLRPRVAPLGMFEIFVHHEDVRRGAGPAPDRLTPEALATAIPWLLRYHGKRLPDVRLIARYDGEVHGHGSGTPVEVAGELGEVVLWLAGRHDACEVELDGDPAAVDQVRAVTRI